MTTRYCGAAAALLAFASLGLAPKEKIPPPGPTPILPAEQVWSTQFDISPASGAAMDAQRVFVPLKVRGLRALNRETGDLEWIEAVDLTHPPIVEDDHLVIALPDAIRGLDPSTGGIRWSMEVRRPLGAPMTAAKGMILAVTDRGEAFAFRARTGQVVWRQELGATTASRPAVILEQRKSSASRQDICVVTLSDGRVVALNVDDGKTIWERTIGGTLSPAAVARDRVLVGSTDNVFYALDARSGEERWKWRTGGDVVGAAADGERVYFVSLDNLLRAVNRGNGNQLWKTAMPTRAATPPVAFKDVVVVAGVAPRVDAYNGKTGASMGTLQLTADLEGTPMIDTMPQPFKVSLVALTRDGRVSGLRPTGLMFPDPPLSPLLKLPGRELPREPRPGVASLP